LSRLFEFAPSYFDISGFPDGETKRALQRFVVYKSRRMPEANGPRRTKKQKVEESRRTPEGDVSTLTERMARVRIEQSSFPRDKAV
jgi:hypothetical protein